MALEFDCPYCKATIRVPDNAAGKRGRCPKCATRLNVPKINQVRRADAAPAFFPAPPEPEPLAVAEPPVGDEDVVFQEFDPQQAAESHSVVEAGLMPGDIAIPDLAPSAPRPLLQPVRRLPDTLLSHRKRPRKSTGIWIMLILAGLATAGTAGGLYWYQTTTTLSGELTADVIENPHLPTKIVPSSLIELPPGEMEEILADLRRNPSELVSSKGLATVVMTGTDEGLSISVGPGSATSLYRVDLTQDKKLAAYRAEHAGEFDATRQENLAIAANQYFRTIKQIAAKKATTTDLGPYRDSVGLAACVEGLGSVVHAVHKRVIYPCVYEDDEALYFLLPAGVKQFQIQGRRVKSGERYFEGKYGVKVTGTTRMEDPEPPESDPTAQPKSKEQSPEKESDDDAMTEN